jgi:plasmid stability protein
MRMAKTATEAPAVLFVKMPPALKAALAVRATENDRTISAELRHVLRKHLEAAA